MRHGFRDPGLWIGGLVCASRGEREGKEEGEREGREEGREEGQEIERESKNSNITPTLFAI